VEDVPALAAWATEGGGLLAPATGGDRSAAAVVASPALASAPQPEQHSEEDRLLAQRAGRGDREAFGMLYQRHVERVHRLLGRLVGPDADREDLVQMVFLDVYRALAGFRGEAAFTTWLHRIVVHTAYEHLRRRKRAANPPLGELPTPESLAVSPEELLRRRQQIRRVLACLDRLKPPKRIAFVLRTIEGLSLEEIGLLVGATPAAVSQRVRHAQRELVAMMERQERRDRRGSP
jgi:RNA polymerase sigma-70 factor (ECF subfamily)